MDDEEGSMINIRLISALVACLALSACRFGGGGSPDANANAPGSGPGSAAATSAQRAPGTIVAANTTQTYDCGGGPVTVQGFANTLHLVGECPALTVTGYGNKITVDRVDAITVTGRNNTLLWGAGISGDPKIANTGLDNTVRQRAGSAPRRPATPRTGAAGGQILVQGHASVRTVACDGKNVVISADASRITLTGRCAKVTVGGHADHIMITSTARLEISGDNNVIQAGGNPQTVDTGHNNVIN
jgi:hypothetical protein